MLKRILWIMSGMVLAVVIAGVVYLVWAGTLDSPGDPSSAGQMYTLDQIYDYLTTGYSLYWEDEGLPDLRKHTGFTEPGAGPTGGTMYTLDDVAGALIRFPATGQTTSYPTGTETDRDDGYYEKGATERYHTYTVGSDVVVVDENTGLEWEQKTVDNKDTMYTWLNAIDYCENQIGTSGTYAGHDDWRLPNIKELQSIVDYGVFNPSINSIFTNTESDDYWSSTTYAGNADYAWYVYFHGGYVDTDFKSTVAYVVRAVRAGH